MPLLSIEEALEHVLAVARPTAIETVPIAACFGRVLAEPLRAARDQPPFDASAMDGYALRTADAPGALRLVGESAAGHPYAGALKAGEAIRISTGAPIPAGADTVVMQEDVTRDGTTLTVPASPLGKNIRPRAGDFAEGAALLEPGRMLSAGDVTLAATAGLAQLHVRRAPRIKIFGGGDELVAPGETPGPAQIFESGSYGVAALARAWGAEAERAPPLPDQRGKISAAVKAQLGAADVLVLIGGASVGDHDHARGALEDLVSTLVFEKVALKPGKPTWLARLGDSVVLGLPGNPASALVTARLFLVPMIERMLVLDPARAMDRIQAKLAKRAPKNGDRVHYMRARATFGEEISVTPMSDQDSSLTTGLSQANALIRQEKGEAVREAGEPVPILFMTPLP
jgi:molybdopterin molybdotransferase